MPDALTLGCTPDWKASENKFKCPCHGSGYDSEGINFEGPAPRPMDRAHVELDPTGQIVVDTARLYKWPKGEKGHFDDRGRVHVRLSALVDRNRSPEVQTEVIERYPQELCNGTREA